MIADTKKQVRDRWNRRAHDAQTIAALRADLDARSSK